MKREYDHSISYTYTLPKAGHSFVANAVDTVQVNITNVACKFIFISIFILQNSEQSHKSSYGMLCLQRTLFVMF